MQKQKLTFNEHTAVTLTRISGSMSFFWTLLIWYGLWMIWNGFAPAAWRFDGQWFPLLLFISNMVQIFLMPIIIVGQNILTRHAEARAEAEFRLTRKIERLLEQLTKMEKTDNQTTAKILSEIWQLRQDANLKPEEGFHAFL